MLQHGFVHGETFRRKSSMQSEKSQDTFLILSLTRILLAAAVFPRRVVVSRLSHLLQRTWAQESEKAVSI